MVWAEFLITILEMKCKGYCKFDNQIRFVINDLVKYSKCNCYIIKYSKNVLLSLLKFRHWRNNKFLKKFVILPWQIWCAWYILFAYIIAHYLCRNYKNGNRPNYKWEIMISCHISFVLIEEPIIGNSIVAENGWNIKPHLS